MEVVREWKEGSIESEMFKLLTKSRGPDGLSQKTFSTREKEI